MKNFRVGLVVMKLPEMNGLEVLGLIGTGESGRVFAAQDEAGIVWAVKVFEGMAVNRGLISRMVARLETGGWPTGVAEIESADFSGRPACWVLPIYGEGMAREKISNGIRAAFSTGSLNILARTHGGG